MNCLGNRRNVYLDEDDERNTFKLAAFLSGLAFYFYPDFSIFSHIVITVVELYYKLNKDRIKSFVPWIPLDKINMMHVFFPPLLGYLLHIRSFTPWLAPQMLKKFMHLTTDARYVLY